jgi:hypothetical protein
MLNLSPANYTAPKKLRILLFVNNKGRTGIDTHVSFHSFSAKSIQNGTKKKVKPLKLY